MGFEVFFLVEGSGFEVSGIRVQGFRVFGLWGSRVLGCKAFGSNVRDCLCSCGKFECYDVNVFLAVTSD